MFGEKDSEYLGKTSDSILLGKGAFGSVFDFSYKDQEVALKAVMLNYKFDVFQAFEEIKTLMGLRQSSKQAYRKKVLHLTQVIISKRFIYIITPKLDGELQTYLKQGKWNMQSSQNLESSACLTSQYLESLFVLHSRGFSHNDIKPQNMMVDAKNKSLVLIDFGLSVKMNTEIEQATCLNGFYAPELLDGRGKYSSLQDSYSVAKQFFYLANYRFIHSGETHLKRKADAELLSNLPFLARATKQKMEERSNLHEFYLEMHNAVFGEAVSLEEAFEGYKRNCVETLEEFTSIEVKEKEVKKLIFPEKDFEINFGYFTKQFDQFKAEFKEDKLESSTVHDIFKPSSLEMKRYRKINKI